MGEVPFERESEEWVGVHLWGRQVGLCMGDNVSKHRMLAGLGDGGEQVVCLEHGACLKLER